MFCKSVTIAEKFHTPSLGWNVEINPSSYSGKVTMTSEFHQRVILAQSQAVWEKTFV